MKTLYVSDLDGTLLNSRGKISEYSCKVINDLVNRGMIFTYATARSLVSATPVTQGLTKNLPLIIYNGTFIVNGKNGEFLYKNTFTQTQVELIRSVMEEFGILPMVYALVSGKERVTIINQNLHEGVKHYLSKRADDYRINLTLNKSIHYEGEVYYFTVIGDYASLEPAYKRLKEVNNLNITFQQEIYRKEYWLEIMPKAASKANAILKLKELLGCERVICFGDALNDISMFDISDEAYAMANATPKLKKIATATIESNDQDGVANWLMSNYGEC